MPCLVDEGQVGELIDRFRHKLFMSGYNQRGRELIVSEGVSCYTNILKQAEGGSRPLYQSLEWQRERRAIGKLIKSKT